MKGKLFIAALALLAVAACNKPENGKTPVNPDAQGQYMAVSLKMSGAPSTKAWSTSDLEDDFEAATEDELTVAKVQFLFFNGDTQCADIFEADALDWGDPTHEDSDDKAAEAIVVLENPIAIPTSIVAVINTEVDLSKAKLSDLASITDFAPIEGTFVMSNSVYVDNGEVVIGTPVTEDNVCLTTTDALKNPVEIHVERVLAKVSLVDKTANADNEGAVDSKGNDIKVVIDGFWLDQINPNANLVKDLAADALDGDWWYDVANFRSYWAKAADADELGRCAYEDADNDDKYVNELTPAAVTPDSDDSENHGVTQIVFATHLEIDGKATDIVKYLSTYYTLDNWKVYIANTLGKYYFQTGDGQTTEFVRTKLTVDDLVFSDPATGENVENPTWDGSSTAYGSSQYIEDWEAVYTVNIRDLDAGESLVLANGTATTFTPASYKVQLFKDGQSYFYAPIVHNDTCLDANKKPAEGYYGIVRNHHYIVNATKIVGLGTPVPDPEQIIIPIKPVETESYIAAEIDVLKYKVVENDYELN